MIVPTVRTVSYYSLIEIWTNTFSLDAVNEAEDDVKVKAVNEMMERIKHGVVLRPVKSQATKVSFWTCTKIHGFIGSLYEFLSQIGHTPQDVELE